MGRNIPRLAGTFRRTNPYKVLDLVDSALLSGPLTSSLQENSFSLCYFSPFSLYYQEFYVDQISVGVLCSHLVLQVFSENKTLSLLKKKKKKKKKTPSPPKKKKKKKKKK